MERNDKRLRMLKRVQKIVNEPEAHTPAATRWKAKAQELAKVNERLVDAIQGAVDHPDLNGPDILEEAAEMLEGRSPTIASQLRKTAKLQRVALALAKGDEDAK